MAFDSAAKSCSLDSAEVVTCGHLRVRDRGGSNAKARGEVTEQALSSAVSSAASPRLRDASVWRDAAVSAAVGIAATAVSYAAARALGGSVALGGLEAFAVFTSYSCTYLAVRQRRINYVVGMTSTAAYAVLFQRQGLYASMVLNLYLTPALIYGWFRWNRDSDTRPVTNLTWRSLPIYAAVTGVFYAGAVLVIDSFDGQMARWDAVILIGSMLAQFLLDNKKLENWIVWAVVNVVAIYVYAQAELYLAAAQYVLFLLNTVYGYWCWKRTMR